MENLTEYCYPLTLREALDLLSKKNSAIIAGGTHLSSQKSSSIERLVDLRNLSFNTIEKISNESVSIGSMVTIKEMIKSPLVQRIGNGVLIKACKYIGDTPIRNISTLGGNIASNVPWAGLPVVLLILDATIVVIQQKNVVKTISAKEFFSTYKLERNEIIKEVQFPIKFNYISKYERFALTETDLPWLIIGFSTRISNGVFYDPHLAVSRIIKPSRISEIEIALDNKEISKIDLNKIISDIKSSIKVIADYRSSKEYRQHLLGSLFKKILEEIIQEVAL